MKTLYNKTFNYYNSDKSENARLTINIELDKKIIKETVSLRVVYMGIDIFKDLERFEKMYNIKNWRHDYSQHLLLDDIDEYVDSYFEKHALNFDDEKRIRKAILNIVKPDYKYIVERLSFDPFNPGIFCKAAINGDNDILAFGSDLTSVPKSTLIEKTKDHITFYEDRNTCFLNFAFDYKGYCVMFDLGYNSDSSSEFKSTPSYVYPETLYCDVSFIKDTDIRKSVNIGRINKLNINLMINDTKVFKEELINYLEIYKDVFDVEPKLNPLFNSNFLTKNEDVYDSLLNFISIGLNNITYNTFSKIKGKTYSSYYVHDDIAYNSNICKIYLEFNEIVNLFKYDESRKKLAFNYASPHIQYILDNHHAPDKWYNIGIYKAGLDKWRKENSPLIYMGSGI